MAFGCRGCSPEASFALRASVSNSRVLHREATMAPLRILLTGRVETGASMAHYLYLSKYDSRWERDDEVCAEDVRDCDVLIADIGLKGRAGCDFVRSLTEQKRRPIVIVISSESEPPRKEP